MSSLYVYKHEKGYSFCIASRESMAETMIQETEFPNDEIEDWLDNAEEIAVIDFMGNSIYTVAHLPEMIENELRKTDGSLLKAFLQVYE